MRLETCSLSFQRKGHLDVHVEWDTATRSWVISPSTQIDRARKKSVRDGRVQTLRKQVRERGRGVIHPTECRMWPICENTRTLAEAVRALELFEVRLEVK